MCFASDARPPELPADLVLPMAGGAGAEVLELESADGTRFAAALAESPEPQDIAVVILPDVRGLYRFYVELAERFAAAGHHAIVLDYFGRTAGAGERDAEFEYWPHVQQATVESVQADLFATLSALRERTVPRAVVAVGFCYGGMQAFLAGTDRALGLDGVVGFYGGLNGGRFGFPDAKTEAEGMRAPVLALFGGGDEGISAQDREIFAASLQESGADHEIVVYDGAPHSFFDRRQAEWAEASEDAWRRTLGFLGELGARVGA